MTAKRNRPGGNEAASGAQGPELKPQDTSDTNTIAGSPQDTFGVTARDASARQPAVVVLTPRKGPAIALERREAWELHKAIMNAVLRIDRTERESALAGRIRAAKRASRG